MLVQKILLKTPSLTSLFILLNFYFAKQKRNKYAYITSPYMDSLCHSHYRQYMRRVV